MSEVPSELKYTAEHEWVRASSGSPSVRIGITDYAQEALGDVVYVSLPEVGAKVSAGVACGEVESTKSVSDLYAPVSGTVVARNESLDDQPELINSDPYGEGWILEIEPTDEADVGTLLDATAYSTLAG
jgi:glycine cleavage system H protein